jgi:enoyl-CoA hydratase/carnithine racemase
LLTLNRPAARNARNADLNTALYPALAEADAADDVRVVVITGADPAFCAGLDLKQAGAEGGGVHRRAGGGSGL